MALFFGACFFVIFDVVAIAAACVVTVVPVGTATCVDVVATSA